MSEWIRVEDRLPKEGQKVLTFRKNLGDIDSAEILYFDDNKTPQWVTGSVVFDDVTHWMSLPKKPENK